MMFMVPGLTIIVTANVVLTTLGLFEHKVLYDARNDTLRLIEAGNGRTDLGEFNSLVLTHTRLQAILIL